MARVLVADDEEQILEVMVDVLEAAGHEVVGVSDGEVRTRDVYVYDGEFRSTGYRPTFLEP